MAREPAPFLYSPRRPGLMNHDKGVDNVEVTSCTLNNQTHTLMGQGKNNRINTNGKWLHENTGRVQNPEQDWHKPIVYSTPTISCPRQGDVSETSVPSSTRATNPIAQAKSFGVENGSNSTEAWRRTIDRVKKSGQDWFTVNSTSTISCPRQGDVFETSVPRSARATNPTTQGFGVKDGSNSTKAGTHNNTGQVQNPEQDWSKVHSTLTISCPKEGNVSGTSVPSSTRATNPITQGFGEKNGSKSTEALRRNNTGRVESSEQNWSTPTLSTPTISCPKQGNISGASVPSSATPTNSITQAKGFGKKKGSNSTKTHKYTVNGSNKVKFAEFPSNPTKFLQAQFSVSGALKLAQRQPRKKFRKLIAHGVPEEEASKLCLMSWPDILKKYPSMIELVPEKRKNQLALHTPPKKIPKLTSETGNTHDSLSKKDGQGSAITTTISEHESLNSQNTAPLRVGIQNKEPMNSDQMKMVHRHLLIAITKQFKSGGGPEFLSLRHKQGWIQVTCEDQRSKDWLVEEVQYLEPWPGVLLSVIPEEQLPNPPKVVIMIPESEAASVQEALDLLKAQNKDLNTGHWQVLHERVEKDKSRTVTLIIDEKSFETLKAQKLQAALGFKIVTFRIKDGGSQLIRRPATKDHVPVTSDGSTIPDNSEDLGLIYATNSVETDRDKHSSTQAKGNERSGIVDLTVLDQDGFAALAAAERVTSQAKNGFGVMFIQNKGVIDLTENYKDEVSGKNRSRAKGQTSQPKFGSRPTIQNSLRQGDVRLGQGSKEVNQTPVRQNKGVIDLTENDKDEVSGKKRSRTKGQTSQSKFGSRPTIHNSLRPGDVRLGQGSNEVNQTPVRGTQSSQDKNGAHLTENRDRTPSPEDTEEGGYNSWIIQDPESFAAGIVPALSFLNSAGPPHLKGDYEPGNIQDPTRTLTGADSGDSGSGRPSEGRLVTVTGQDSSLKSDRRSSPLSYTLPVRSRRKDRGTRGNSQDSQVYDRFPYSQDSGRRGTVKSWENWVYPPSYTSPRGHAMRNEFYSTYGATLPPWGGN